MGKIWIWIQRIVWLIAIISFIKGWIDMQSIKLLWDRLTPWQLIFFLALAIILYELVIFFIQLNRKVSAVHKQAYRHDHNTNNIQEFDKEVNRVMDERIAKEKQQAILKEQRRTQELAGIDD